MFCIVLGIFLSTAYFIDYKDGHREVEAVKARYEQADKDTAESVKNPSISSIRTVRSVLTRRCMILGRDNLSTVSRAGAVGQNTTVRAITILLVVLGGMPRGEGLVVIC